MGETLFQPDMKNDNINELNSILAICWRTSKFFGLFKINSLAIRRIPKRSFRENWMVSFNKTYEKSYKQSVPFDFLENDTAVFNVSQIFLGQSNRNILRFLYQTNGKKLINKLNSFNEKGLQIQVYIWS